MFYLKHPNRLYQKAIDAFVRQSCFVDGFYLTVTITDPTLVAGLANHNPSKPLVS